MRNITRTVADANKTGTKLPVYPINPEDFPRTGSVRLREFTSHSGQIGMLRMSPNTFLRRVKDGTFPEGTLICNARHWRVEHIRAIAAGTDWRRVNFHGE